MFGGSGKGGATPDRDSAGRVEGSVAPPHRHRAPLSVRRVAAQHLARRAARPGAQARRAPAVPARCRTPVVPAAAPPSCPGRTPVVPGARPGRALGGAHVSFGGLRATSCGITRGSSDSCAMQGRTRPSAPLVDEGALAGSVSLRENAYPLSEGQA
ncbi:hypothetical protein SCWH03_40120 [Streptomyces pacificus]|uniref:Uncharacterized protein n=1 Tax=Streptomyces pacificus TaxID=2705029 RepID=A0A6A0AY55_9ACTN|nr:hypothetical protein SCWH03_40120 [Streptomyces pacificus]